MNATCFRGQSFMTLFPLEGYVTAVTCRRHEKVRSLLSRVSDAHSLSEMRSRHLFHWLGTDPDGIYSDWVAKNWDHPSFHPFLTLPEAEALVTKNKGFLYLRLSGTVPGHISVTWWAANRDKPKHTRVEIVPGMALLESLIEWGRDMDMSATPYSVTRDF